MLFRLWSYSNNWWKLPQLKKEKFNLKIQLHIKLLASIRIHSMQTKALLWFVLIYIR